MRAGIAAFTAIVALLAHAASAVAADPFLRRTAAVQAAEPPLARDPLLPTSPVGSPAEESFDPWERELWLDAWDEYVGGGGLFDARSKETAHA